MKKNLKYAVFSAAGIVILAMLLWFGGLEQSLARPLPLDEASRLTDVVDLEVDQVPVAPTSAHYVIEHRTALNGAMIRVQGLITAVDPSGHMVVISAGKKSKAEPAYDLIVRTPARSSSGDYLVGQQVIMRGIVRGSPESVYLESQETEKSIVFKIH